ncbi:F0F1-type ATP synthase membrane subunit b/b' [Natronobacillus azotifigens]|uniref:Uncharacterized protein n=1 Tax=Natronobacillus azotifigens TaxID=472978 RepID=A0A9J6R9M5_9BACI|nr:hypothetical protein [Natronobacillus azotifigens]MCZ0701980.1 hypothetical protein [Natronobacillus azotifigens]
MGLQTIDEVREIERQAESLAVEYQEKIDKLEQTTQAQIAEMQKNVETEIKNFTDEEEQKKEAKLAEVRSTYRKQEEEDIAELQTVFASKKDLLVDKVIEEVMRKYGNS